MNRLVLVDTNIILRYLLGDNRQLAKKARQWLLQAKQGLVNLVVLECVAIETTVMLLRYYKMPKKVVVEAMRKVLSLSYLEVENRSQLVDALEFYRQHGVDFVDSLLLAKTKKIKARLITFDKKLAQLAK